MGNCCATNNVLERIPSGKTLRNKTQRYHNWAATGIIALRDQNLKELPDTIAAVGDVARTLDATNNRLTQLPDSLWKLTNLQRLELSKNQIPFLPVDIRLLLHLKVLALDQNTLTELPEALAALTALEKLSLAGNMLVGLPPALGECRHLKELQVKGNKLKDLPTTLSSCTTLEMIDAADNFIQAIPAEFGQLSSLKSLLLDSNRISAVPASVLQGCTAMQTLSLHHNPITLEILQATEGFEEYEARRKAKYDKKIAGGLAIDKGLDEGVDR